MNGREFTLRDTNICKGIAIILMYIHHLFYSVDTVGINRVDFWLLSKEIWIYIASICKVCVAIFVFLTAYGFTAQDKLGNVNMKRRYSKLLFGFAIVYIDSQIISYFTERTRVSVYGEGFWSEQYFPFLIC